jgi:Tat protein translocase TatC
VIWQGWAFIAAGLYPRERRVFYRYFPFLVLLLVGGVLFGYYIAVPYGLGFLIRMQVTGIVTSMLSVANYFTFLFALGAAMGLIFQLPLVMVALQKIGLVRHRTYVRNWRMIVLIIFILAAVLTPPDPFSMTIMAAPTLCLYLLGLVLTKIGSRHEPPDVGAVSTP